jgi:5'-deoxynucleotidase YfbR-like HD superfamily hydrolase
MQGYGGDPVDHDDPWRTTIRIETIAHALAMIPRFGGHTHFPYSVALHSLHVSTLLEARLGHRGAVMGLLHDAHEAFVGDVTTPAKRKIGRLWAVFEARWEQRVREAFPGWDWRELDLYEGLCKEADLTALATERAQLLPPHVDTPEYS